MVSTKSGQKEAVVLQLPRRGYRLFDFTGDAMMGAHIVPNSKLLVDTERMPQNGDVVVVEIGRKFTVRLQMQ
jgi:SOS-response transcriptional repressor LexA